MLFPFYQCYFFNNTLLFSFASCLLPMNFFKVNLEEMDFPKVKRPCRPEPKTIVPNALCLRKPQYQNFNVNEERDTLRKGLLGLCLSVEIWSQLRHFHQLYFSVSYTTPFLCGLLILFSSIFYLLANLASTLLFKVQFPFQCITVSI